MSFDALLFVVLGSLILSVAGIVGAMAGQLYERRKWERRLLELSGVLRGKDAEVGATRMEHLEQAVDAIAVELERVGEGQRFVTKLLADRASARSPQPGTVPAARPPTA